MKSNRTLNLLLHPLKFSSELVRSKLVQTRSLLFDRHHNAHIYEQHFVYLVCGWMEDVVGEVVKALVADFEGVSLHICEIERA